jgi:amino acid adenylation domain-containing protein
MIPSELQSRVSALTPAKRALWSAELKKRPSAVGIPRRADPAALIPLTQTQERIWMAAQMFPDSPLYNVSWIIQIREQIEIGHLDRCFTELVRRHEALRIVFVEEKNAILQRVLPPFSPELVYVNLQSVPAEKKYLAARTLAHQDAAMLFDLAAGPLVRLTAMSLLQNHWILSLVSHHLISDAWSLSTLERELRTLLRSSIQYGTSPLDPLIVQFPDYAVWQRSAERQAAIQRQAEYWKQKLEDAPGGIRLPADRPADSRGGAEGALEIFGFASHTADAVRKRASEARTTPFAVFLAAYFAFLFRCSGQSDLIVTSPIADRRWREVESMVGLLLNSLTIRIKVSGRIAFRELLAEVRECMLEAYDNQDFPADCLLRQDFDRQRPCMRVTFGLQPNLGPGSTVREIDTSALAGNGSAKFDLSLILIEASDGLVGAFEYRTAWFDRSTIQRWSAEYASILRDFVANPGLTLETGGLPEDGIASAVARSAGPMPSTSWTSLPAQIAAHAMQHPKIPAVMGKRIVTYGELDQAADRLDRWLRGMGLHKGDTVAVLLDRSPEWVAVFAGVMKSGMVYMPVDPSYPAKHIDFILSDSGATLVVTDEQHYGQASVFGGHVAVLGRDFDPWIPPESGPSNTLIMDDELAYQIYTSGSSGVPKGVQLTHRGLGRMADAQGAVFAPSAGDRVLSVSSVSFDASIFDLSMALGHGAAIWLAGAEEIIPGLPLLQTLERAQATILTVPPTLLAVLPEAELPCLRAIISAGERCPAWLAKRWRRGRRFFNAYGPTECTVWATFHECTNEDDDPPIGRPIPGAHVYVVSDSGKLCADGIPGEIWIGGEPVGQGYWQRPDITERHFVPDPFQAHNGGRVYKTGDAGMWRKDGNLEFRGRMDRQVKIHGFRVEPSDVEAALERLDAVAQVAVHARETPDSEPVLTAYVIPSRPVSESDIRHWLLETLPRFMVPSRIHMVESLPRTPNGKVDYASLSSTVSSASKPPESELLTDLEQRLAEIWKEVLGVEQVNATSDFFELGGHSLLLGRLFVRVREGLARNLSLKDLFETPVLRDMARKLQGAEAAPTLDAIPRITRDYMPARNLPKLGQPDGSAS